MPKPVAPVEIALSKRKQSRKIVKRQSIPASPPESPASRGLTVFWMTSLLATVLAEAVSLAMRLMLWFEASPTLQMFANVMLLIATVTGVVCLILTPLVLRYRDAPPPRAITLFAIAASLLPIVTLAVVLLWGRL